MSPLFVILLFLHVLAAIIAFGPSFSFPIIGAMGGREPMHGNFALRVSEALEKRMVLPFAISMPITGILMIWAGSLDLLAPGFHWLDLAIILYAIAIFIAIVLQNPVVGRMVEMTSHAPQMAGGPGAAPAGPPPEFLALVKRSQLQGMILGALIVVIVFLMVVKPTF
jgi:uncharacterized membrane protein